MDRTGDTRISIRITPLQVSGTRTQRACRKVDYAALRWLAKLDGGIMRGITEFFEVIFLFVAGLVIRYLTH
jgi:hypothetical protein